MNIGTTLCTLLIAILNTKGKPINLTLLPNPTGMAKRSEKEYFGPSGNFPIFKPGKSN